MNLQNSPIENRKTVKSNQTQNDFKRSKITKPVVGLRSV